MRAPDIERAVPVTKAWSMAEAIKAHPGSATIAAWIVHAPWAHAAWSFWMMSVVHLRPIEGFPPVRRHYPEAEYEFLIQSIDPERCPEPNPDAPQTIRFLTPVDAVVQFDGVSDEDAGRILEAAVRAVIAGRMSPDSDFREAWKQCIAATAQHFRAGGHVLQ